MITTTRTLKIRGRFAAPARESESQRELAEARRALPPHIHAVCDAWGAWCETRRYYGPPAQLPSVLGQLGKRVRTTAPGTGPNAPASGELAAFHLAVIAQPPDALDRVVFEAHYRLRVRQIKRAAAVLGIGRQHWYTLLNGFARRAYAAHFAIAESVACTGDKKTVEPMRQSAHNFGQFQVST